MEKNFALCSTKKINILTRVVRKNISERKKTQNIAPTLPLQVKWSVPYETVKRSILLSLHCLDYLRRNFLYLINACCFSQTKSRRKYIGVRGPLTFYLLIFWKSHWVKLDQTWMWYPIGWSASQNCVIRPCPKSNMVATADYVTFGFTVIFCQFVIPVSDLTKSLWIIFRWIENRRSLILRYLTNIV